MASMAPVRGGRRLQHAQVLPRRALAAAGHGRRRWCRTRLRRQHGDRHQRQRRLHDRCRPEQRPVVAHLRARLRRRRGHRHRVARAGGTSTTDLDLDGRITGVSGHHGESGARAYLYTDGHMKNLGVLPGDVWSGGRGLNGKGHVVGASVDDRHHFSVFFYNGTKMKRLGTLGGAQAYAWAVNYSDVVVGTAQTAARVWHPFVIDKGSAGTTMRYLQTMLDSSGASGWSLSGAIDINNAGQILVVGSKTGDDRERSALLTPVR